MLFPAGTVLNRGMGGRGHAGMPLVLEHWPAHLRGIASGLLQGGFAWGYIIAATAFQFLYPLFAGTPDLGWRAMFWVGLVPALLTFWIRARVTESPLWLDQQRGSTRIGRHHESVTAQTSCRLFDLPARDRLAPESNPWSCRGFRFSYYSKRSEYGPSCPRVGEPTFAPLCCEPGGIVGTAMWGSPVIP